MVPPVNPSPHRFVINQESLRSTPTGSQFNAAPRFNFASTPQPKSSCKYPKFIPKILQFQTPSKKKLFEYDTIEIEPENSTCSGEDPSEDLCFKSRPEHERKHSENIEHVPKRRRRSPSSGLLDQSTELVCEVNQISNTYDDPFSPSPLSSAPSSPLPMKLNPTRAPRFLISSPNPILASQVVKESFIFAKPPVFRPPDPTNQPNPDPDPDPDLFSPHRRGEKYIAGGLAAELRSWLINIKSSIPSPQIGEKNQWLIKIQVDEFSGNFRSGMILVRGKRLQDLEGEIRDTTCEISIILARESSAIGIQKSTEIENGSIIGIKGPMWEVNIDNKKWCVGVDWKVI